MVVCWGEYMGKIFLRDVDRAMIEWAHSMGIEPNDLVGESAHLWGRLCAGVAIENEFRIFWAMGDVCALNDHRIEQLSFLESILMRLGILDDVRCVFDDVLEGENARVMKVERVVIE